MVSGREVGIIFTSFSLSLQSSFGGSRGGQDTVFSLLIFSYLVTRSLDFFHFQIFESQFPRIQAPISLFLPFISSIVPPHEMSIKSLGLFSQVNLALTTLASCLSYQMFSLVFIQEFSPSQFTNQALSAWDSSFAVGEFLP